ncbi:LOW QUALITY PROTEIN: hypothetical protein RvY_04642 [Ramazzottius varieornatus]|uniref:Uncharacterized protein n=1 Tax=Ramazzottius varieornatus TaxID=947166 RepID=A0A1D1USB2_RAMVA|nr:LOW QUALITY PROTEIN: hypothetical protein RvY_04642 [Ramazzottius varieornatus]
MEDLLQKRSESSWRHLMLFSFGLKQPDKDKSKKGNLNKFSQLFPNGSAGGVDGLRPQHLKDMLSGAPNGATVALAEALAKLITLMLLGRIPDAICGVLYGASFTALKKKDGGLETRYVAWQARSLAREWAV